jgi:DNA-binding response OmpR family regulator
MPARVLIVDDDPAVRGLLSDLLTGQGYTVETASTGAAALVAARERQLDAILLDLNLPGTLDGRGVLGAIGQEIPVIVITGGDVVIARSMLRTSAFDVIAKPFDLHHLSERVAAAVAYRTAVDPRLRPSPARRTNTAVRPDAHRPLLRKRGLLPGTDSPPPPRPTS